MITGTGRRGRRAKWEVPLSEDPDPEQLCACCNSAMACDNRARLMENIRLLQKRLDEAMAREAKRQARDMK